jgi:hypothetical protein
LIGRGLRAAVGGLPAIFWVFYTLWNTALAEPPALGRLTPISVLYVLMLPAMLALAIRWRQVPLPGRWLHLAFVAWLALGIVWHDRSPGTDAIKALFVCALALPIAAQMWIGGRGAQIALVAATMLTASAISVWMIGEALVSGFQYRTGTLLNQNFMATMIAPGLLAALSGYLMASPGGRRRLLLCVTLLCLYATLLLGSRGVMLAELVAIGVLAMAVRPAWLQLRGLAAGTAVVLVIAQVPAIPNAIWVAGWSLAADVQPVASAPPAGAASPAPPVAAPAAVTRPLNPLAAQSTALGRFTEKHTGTLDKRTGLWRAIVRFTFSRPSVLLFGGGLGISGAIAETADPVFHNAHNVYLQVLADAGLVGAAILAALLWTLMRLLIARATTVSLTWLAVLVFWLIAGMTATVIDLHVFWLSVGAAMAAARQVRSSKFEVRNVAEVSAR